MEEELHSSEQKFAFAFNSSPDVIFLMDMQTEKFIEINDAVKEVFGYRREEVLNKGSLELGIYKDPSDRQKLYDTLAKQGYIRKMELVGKHKSGSDMHGLISMQQSVIDGKPCLLSIIHDITERKRAEEEIRKSEARLKSFISVSNAGAWEYYSDTKKLWVSDVYLNILGRNRADYDITDEESLQKLWVDLLHPDDREYAINVFAEYLKNGSKGTYEIYFRMKHADGGWRWIWDRGQTLRDEQGNMSNLTIGTHIDITERKQGELELEKLNNDKNRFMSILSHDLRDPVIAVYSLVDQLYEDFEDFKLDEIKSNMFLIRKTAENTMNFLDELLQWAKIQSGKMPFKPVDLNVNEICNEIIEMRKSSLEKKNIEVILDSANGMKAYADKEMIKTVLRNLLSNAIKFTKKGGQINISAQEKEGNTLISVSDNGVGIDDVNKIFNPSQLYTNTGTEGEKGNGLGLNICKEFVEMHQGKIWVESEFGKGTTFYFSLPLESSPIQV
jgi:PAS domain S-box-containing protein